MMIRSIPIGRRRRGAVAVLVAVSLTVLLMVLAIAMDGGLMFSERRHAQAVADAAALAGAADLFKNYAKNQGYDSSGSAAAAALFIANSNGYANDGTTSVVVVRTPGQTYLNGPNAGAAIKPGYVEVTVTYNFPRFFSLIFGSDTIPIKARAVATGTWTVSKFGVVLLEPTNTAVNNTGNGAVNITSGPLIVNSSNPAAIINKNNSTIQASEIDITGGLANSGTIVTSPVANNVQTGVPPMPDSLAFLPAPAAPATAGAVTSLSGKAQADILASLVAGGQITQAFADTATNVYLATPGAFNNMQSFHNGDLVVFTQASGGSGGIYYLNSGGFNSTGASLLMDPNTSGGMMIYNNGAGQNDKLSLSGDASGVVNLMGETSGAYAGMLYFQNRLATEPIAISGNGAFNIQGTLYAPNADFSLSGNGGSSTIGSQILARTLTVSGNGAINVALTNNGGTLAPKRVFRLVE